MANGLDGLDCASVRSWTEIETMRQALHRAGGRFSRAELCRRAGINQDTYRRGMRLGTPVSKAVLRHVRLALEGQRHAVMAGIAGEAGQ